MGLLTRAVNAALGGTKQVATTVPVGQLGIPQNPDASYERFAREGYSQNELVYACVEELCTSAAEPRFAAYRETPDGKEPVEHHPLLDLLENPNPFMGRFDLVATWIMHRMIAGNAYTEKVRSGAGKLVELWTLRPDRVRVVPDEHVFIGSYRYTLGQGWTDLDPGDVMHSRQRHALNDWYGMPPLMPAAGRIDIDNWMRQFVAAFWTNAGVPSGLLNIKQAVSKDQKDEIKGEYRGEFGGPRGWHRLMVLADMEATYTQMGLPLGQRGLALPELDEINEGRICAALGVPAPLVGARLGVMKATYGKAFQEVRASFWDETLIPLYRSMESDINRSLVPEFAGIDGVEFDLSSIQALQEDENAKHERWREDVKGSIAGVREARRALGLPDEPDEPDTFLVPVQTLPTRSEQVFDVAEPEPVPEQFSHNGAREGEGVTA